MWWHAVQHWLAVHTGTVNEAGPYYGFWSGFGSDLGELALIGAVYGMLRKHNCHEGLPADRQARRGRVAFLQSSSRGRAGEAMKPPSGARRRLAGTERAVARPARQVDGSDEIAHVVHSVIVFL